MPLFLVHPIGGSVYLYRALAEALDRPVYGIQAQGLEGDTTFLHRIEDMAALYVRTMRAQQPKGPYALGGASMGGMIAFEMAQQLQALGESVALLVMMDTSGPGHMPVKLETNVEIMAYLLNISTETVVNEIQPLAFEQQLCRFLEHQKSTGQTVLPEMDVAQAQHLLEMFKVNNDAMWRYQPQRYAGRIVFFRAEETDDYNPAHPEAAWMDLVQDLDIIDVPGNHLSMNMAPHVQVLLKRLQQNFQD